MLKTLATTDPTRPAAVMCAVDTEIFHQRLASDLVDLDSADRSERKARTAFITRAFGQAGRRVPARDLWNWMPKHHWGVW